MSSLPNAAAAPEKESNGADAILQSAPAVAAAPDYRPALEANCRVCRDYRPILEAICPTCNQKHAGSCPLHYCSGIGAGYQES